MMTTMDPTLNTAALTLTQGREALLVQLTVPVPDTCAIALALDMSDSCPSLRQDVARALRLLDSIPRHWMFWIYRLSSPVPLDQSRGHTISHLQDQSLDLLAWLDDRQVVARGNSTGSVIRPTLDAIEQRRRREGIARVIVLVLTDGELLDIAPVEVPDALHVVGIAASTIHQGSVYWQRVLPGRLLHALSDPDLDLLVSDRSSPFYGRCSITWAFNQNVVVDAMPFDAKAKRLCAARAGNMEWNFLDGPLHLILNSEPAIAPGLCVRCTSLRTGQLIDMYPANGDGAIALDVVSSAIAACSFGTQQQVQVVVDASTGQAEFLEVSQSLRVAADLADRCEPWIDSDGKLKTFNTREFSPRFCNLDGQSKWDALVCICTHEPRMLPQEGATIVVIGLDRQAKPALRLSPHARVGSAEAAVAVEIAYDRMEGRWILTMDGHAPRELEPRGSERLVGSLITSDIGPCHAFFSGDLR